MLNKSQTNENWNQNANIYIHDDVMKWFPRYAGGNKTSINQVGNAPPLSRKYP